MEVVKENMKNFSVGKKLRRQVMVLVICSVNSGRELPRKCIITNNSFTSILHLKKTKNNIPKTSAEFEAEF